VILTHRIHVLCKKEELNAARTGGRVAIVLDILFATSTIVTALAHGASEVIPALDEAAARKEAAGRAPDSFVMAGELDAVTLPGFAPPTPLALLAHGIEDRTLIYSTTNGTVALAGAAGAEWVYAGAMLNARALLEHVLAAHPASPILLVCAGSADNFNLEDFYGAGYFIELLAARLGEAADFSDAARAARALYRSGEPYASLVNCRVGRMMEQRGLLNEVRHAAQLSVLDVVPMLHEEKLIRVQLA
jgi:2-phosphosulfolactate phosphatase